MDFGSLTSIATQWLLSPLIWGLIIIGLVAVTIGVLYFRRKGKLVYPAAEIVDLGKGKTCIYFLGNRGAGWFGKDKTLFGLWDYGDRVMRTKDMTIIEQFSEEDFQEVNGKRAIIFYKDPTTGLLFPINKLKVEGRDLITKIAPAEYTQTAVDIYKNAKAETSDKYEKLMQIAAIAMVVIFALVALIVVTQMVKNGQTEAAKLITESGKTCMENARLVCSEIVSHYAGVSSAP